MGVAKWPPNARSLLTIKVVKFVIGKRKSVDLWRKARPTKMSLGAKPVLKTGMAKWLPKWVVEVGRKVLGYRLRDGWA